MRKRRIIVICICLLLLCVAGFCKCVADFDEPSTKFDYEGVRGNIMAHWDEELPPGGSMKFEIDDIGGFPMDGATFAVIDYSETVLERRYEEWMSSKEWTAPRREDIESIKALMEELTVEKKYRPDLSKLEIYKRTKSDGYDDLYILHEKDSDMIYVLESLI